MEAYTDFAAVYDTFMDETPYESWKEFIINMIEKYGVSKPKTIEDTELESEQNLVLDLGCGTGTLTQMMADEKFDMIGVDLSCEMLELAQKKNDLSKNKILYLQQDMVELDLFSTVGTVISVCDSLNYILDKKSLFEVFQKVNKFLYPKGLFIFDFNTVYKYKNVIGDTTIAENREDCSFIWENYYNEEENINEYDITVFVKKEKGHNNYYKFEETHYQKGYEVEEVRYLIQEAGLEIILMIDADTKLKYNGTSERVFVVARECEKEKSGENGLYRKGNGSRCTN